MNDSHDGYLNFVMQEAKRIYNKIFMLDTGEGNDYEYKEKGWYVEELSGWLIEPDRKEKFILYRRNGNEEEMFEDDRVWVDWAISGGKLTVSFRKL